MITVAASFSPTSTTLSVVCDLASSPGASHASPEAAARQRDGKRLVTAIHKRTVFQLTDGLFMDTVENVGRLPGHHAGRPPC